MNIENEITVEISDRARAIVALEIERDKSVQHLAELDADQVEQIRRFQRQRAEHLKRIGAFDRAILEIWNGREDTC